MKYIKSFKIIIDFCLSFVGIIILLPLFFILVFIIKLTSKGPAIFSHTRYGYNGKTFPAYKFRSMVLDADKVLNKYLNENPSLKEEWDKDQKLKNDPRITWIGNILRKTSLDELPQLFNILRGDMSLVGPRPIVENEIKKYGEVYELYKKVRPGITGLWQVSGRNNTTYEERINFDKEYIENLSFRNDVFILIRTIKVVLFREGAY